MSGRKLLVAVVGLGCLVGTAAACSPSSPPSPSASTAPTTKLIIEITGGFAYIPKPDTRTLNVAYLDDVTITENGTPVCEVDQIGTELLVVRGNIIDSQPNPAPPNRTFNLDKAIVKIPALDTVNTPLTFTRPNWPPSPAKGTQASHWRNLQYVPSLSEHHGSNVVTDWDQKVNGYFMLKGGHIEATVPTDPSIQQGDFEFKHLGGSKGNFSLTDKTIYTVDVPGTSVELEFDRATYKYKTLKIAPPAPGQPVRLKLRGLHNPGAVSSFAPGDEIKDFCAFYSLVNPKQDSSKWVKIFYNGPGVAYGPAGAKPSPGYFCAGDWF